MVSPTIVNLNMNFNYHTLDLVANLMIIGYFSYMTTQYCLKRYDINLLDVIDQVINKIVKETSDHNSSSQTSDVLTSDSDTNTSESITSKKKI